jgi:TonB family protein
MASWFQDMRSLQTQFAPNTLTSAQDSVVTPARPEAWKKLIGVNPVSARFEMLPEAKLRRSALLTSLLFQSAVATFLISLSLIFPNELKTRILHEIVPVAAPVNQVLLPSANSPSIVPKYRLAPPQLVAESRRIVFAPLRAPRPVRAEVARQDVPEIKQAIDLDSKAVFDATNEPERPREPVKTGLLETGNSSPPTVDRPLDRVQTGGFGATDGAAGKSDPARRAEIPHLGALSLPPGSGQGNGTRGDNAARGVVASSGFGNGVAIAVAAPSTEREVKAGNFAAAAVKLDTPDLKQHAETAPLVQPVVILDKATPIYSEEGRRLGIEGEVLVQVVFLASGGVQVVHVIEGLGHGLDEEAVRAAKQIHFKPALQNGRAVDSPATVHIVFQLAF